MLATHVLDVATVSLVLILSLLGLLCLGYSIHFRSRIRNHPGGISPLQYFHGPWVARIAIVVLSIWSGFGEILRVNLVRGETRFFAKLIWQKSVCEFYLVSNVGFAEPSLFLVVMLLLRASIRSGERGPLSRRWNARVGFCTVFFCLPMFVVQLVLVFVGPKLYDEEKDLRKMHKYFVSSSSWTGDHFVCTYPLVGTVALGLFYFVLIIYVLFVGFGMVRSVINKGLQRRIYFLVGSIVLFLPFRVCLLGSSVIPRPGGLVYESVVFVAFLMLLLCASISVCLLVYYPVADSLALTSLTYLELEEVPFDDYFDGASSLAVNQSHLETGRNSDASFKHGSISFRTMLRDELPSASEFGEAGVFYTATPMNSSPGEFRPIRSLV